MDFIDRIHALAGRAERRELLETEEATKMALVVPFIAALGYDVYNPLEVVPEYTADVGIKKGEKVDYAILKDGVPILLFECKKVGVDLDHASATQLYRYFSVTKARVGIVTDGITYRFFSDIEAENKMDERPFLVVDIQNIDDFTANELKRFVKEAFDLDSLLGAAEELKYTRALKQILADEMQSPSDEFVRFLAGQVYTGRFSKNAREKFQRVVKKAFNGFINDRIERRLQAALHREVPEEETDDAAADVDSAGATTELPDGVVAVDGDVVTTEDERDAFLIVKAIVRAEVDPARVHMRDTKSYCGILLDDNNRKPICRLRFNGKSKNVLGLLDADKNETKVEIGTLDELYQHSDALRATVRAYLQG